MHIYIINVALSYMYIPYIEAAYTNYFTSSLDIYAGKTPVFNSSALFAYLSINRKPCYSGSLSLNRSINPTSISL